MKIRIMSMENEIKQFSDLLLRLEEMEIIEIISASKPYPNRNSKECRCYCVIKILKTNLSNEKINKRKSNHVELDYKKYDSEYLEYLEYLSIVFDIDGIVLLKAIYDGFYYIADNEIYYKDDAVLVGHRFVETKPVYAVKEITLESYYGNVSSLKEVKDAHYWDWKTCRSWHLRDYKKTWSLKKEDLEYLLKEPN